MESSILYRLFSVVLTVGVLLFRSINAQECKYIFNAPNLPLNLQRNGKMAAQQIACTLPTFDWINTEYELYLDLTWYEPNRDFRLCFRQASIEKIVVRYTDAQRVTQPGNILPTGYTANENQKCMMSIDQRLQVAFRQASEVPINAVWIDMRVELLGVIAPGPNNKDSQCISRDRSISGGEFYSVTFGCSGENTLTWYDTSSVATTGTFQYGSQEEDFEACFSNAIRSISITHPTTGKAEIVDNTLNRKCFTSSNRQLQLILRTLDEGTFNGIYMTVHITPSSSQTPDQGIVDVGLVGERCQVALKETNKLDTVLICQDTTITWKTTSIAINPAEFTWYKRNQDFTLCFIRASHAIDVQSPQTGQSFRISTTDKYRTDHCIKATEFLVLASLRIASFTYDPVNFVVRVIPLTEMPTQPLSCGLVYMGVESFSSVLHCPETTLSWYETNGVLAGVFEWYQGVDFITCVKESAKPLSLNYIKGNSIVEVAYDSEKYPKGYCMKSQNGKLQFTLDADNQYPVLPVGLEIQPCQSQATCVLPDNYRNSVDPQSGSDNQGKDTNGDGLNDLMNYSDSTSGGLTPTAIILIVLAIVLVLLIAVISTIAYCHKKNKMDSSDTDSDTAGKIEA